MSDDPRRWLDSEIPSELRDVLSSADGDRPRPTQLTDLQTKLEQAIGPEFGGGAAAEPAAQPQASAASSTAATGGGAALGGALALAAALMLALGALWYAGQADEAKEQGAVQVQSTETALPTIAEVAPALGVAPPAAALPQPSAAAPRAPQAARPVRQVAQAGGLVEELRQLEAIRRRLPGQPAQALTAIAQHARRFPQGALGPERELLRIEALQRARRGEEAQRAAEKALAAEGGHPYAVQIRQLMAAPGGDPTGDK